MAIIKRRFSLIPDRINRIDTIKDPILAYLEKIRDIRAFQQTKGISREKFYDVVNFVEKVIYGPILNIICSLYDIKSHGYEYNQSEGSLYKDQRQIKEPNEIKKFADKISHIEVSKLFIFAYIKNEECRRDIEIAKIAYKRAFARKRVKDYVNDIEKLIGYVNSVPTAEELKKLEKSRKERLRLVTPKTSIQSGDGNGVDRK